MKAMTVRIGCALLVLGMLAASTPVDARTAKRKSAKRQVHTTSKQDWRVGEPINFQNLAVFPILSNAKSAPTQYITLDQGLRSGKVIVSEIGVNGRTHRLQPGHIDSGSAQVNTLLVTNRSGKPLILIAGELVVGGNQDRMVGHDCLIEASAKPVPIDVFCVEHGRWSEDSEFGRNRTDTIGTSTSASLGAERRSRRGRGHAIGRGHGGGVGTGVVTTGGGSFLVTTAPGNFASANEVMAAPELREKAQALKNQSAVWDEVSTLERENNAASSTGTINHVIADKNVAASLSAYEHELREHLPADAVGIIAAINGQIVSADVFAAPSVFRVYWPKLLRSLALQATSKPTESKDLPSVEQAHAFLTQDLDTRKVSDHKPLYTLVESQSDREAIFELESSSKAARSMIHFNKVTRH
ncbi:MAG TPA: DUF6569 family protein [Blastocatellia bacterium]|nr:DUF6569 family protein [Blastocatellia bacterium]